MQNKPEFILHLLKKEELAIYHLKLKRNNTVNLIRQ